MILSSAPLLRRVAFFALVLIGWQSLVWLGLWPAYIFPSPLRVAQTLVRGFQNGTFIIGIATSMQCLVIGFGISGVLGLAVMLVIIALGLVVDRLIFTPIESRVRERWGLHITG